MLDTAGVVSFVGGLGGIILTQIGPLMPVRKDFMSTLKLKKEACLERLAASHCVLVKASQIAWGTEFDDEMRGDGRTTRDYFAEHASVSISQHSTHDELTHIESKYRFWHGVLFGAIFALLVFGASIALLGLWIAFATWIAFLLLSIEASSFFMIYVLNSRAERIP